VIEELSQGSIFAGYRIERLVGRGGMGVVYLATDFSLERLVALKLIAPELAEDDGFRDRFLREARLTGQLGHPGVVPVYETGVENGQLFTAMRYIERGDLKALLGQGPLPPEQALSVLGQVAEALDAAHERGLVHRDMKPANVLLDERGHAYLSDFGLSKHLHGPSTETGPLAGTLDYLAPEQIRGEQVDGKTDQYALACVLFECLAGRPPFRRRSEAETLWAHMHEEPPSLPDHPTLEPVLRRGLAKGKDERYPTCSDLIDAAGRALELKTPGLRRRRLMRGGRALLAAGALVLAGAISALVLHLTGGGSRPLPPGSIAALDTATGRLIAAVSIPGRPTRLASHGDPIWVGDDDAGTVSALNGKTRRVTRLVAAGGFPSDLAVGEGALWVMDGRSGLLRKVDPVYGAVTRSIRVAAPNPAYDASREGLDPTSVAAGLGSVWLTDGSAELARVDPRAGRVAERIDLGAPLNSATVGAGAVWAASGPSAIVLRLDGDGRATARIPIVSRPDFESPYPLSVRVGEGSVWVLNGNTATVTRIDPQQRAVLATITLGIDHGPVRLAVGGGAAWVANGDGTLSRIDAATNTVRTIPLAHRLKDVAVAGGLVWVSAGSGLSSSLGSRPKVTGVGLRALPTSSCSPISYTGGGSPQYVIASDFPLQGRGRTAIAQLSQAVGFVLEEHGFKAGRYRVGYQSCDDSTAAAGGAAPEKCEANARAYAANPSVIGVIGSWSSFCSGIEIPILNSAPGGPLAMISPSSTYLGLTRRGAGTAPGEPDSLYPTGIRNFARLVAADDIQGAADAILAHRIGAKSVYVLQDGNDYGRALAASFAAAARRLGLHVFGPALWDGEASRPLASRIGAKDADAVFLGTFLSPASVSLVRRLRASLPPRTLILAPDGFSPPEDLVRAAGPAAEGMWVSTPGLPNSQLPPAGRRFVESFTTSIGETPYQWPVAAAQATEVLLAAIARSDGTRSSVTRELFATQVADGLLGDFSIDENGDTTAGAVAIYRIRNGKPRLAMVITPPPRLAR
jgi:ABC-type branched-subunit amino acid transport system substrate-binding protein